MALIVLAITFLILAHLEGCQLHLTQEAQVAMSFQPPATNVSGNLSFSYCVTASVKVNVTCTVEGIDAVFISGILPQIRIGQDVFYPNNKDSVSKWGILFFIKNLTLLFFELPLTADTDRQSISCQSENYSSPNITVLSDDNQCIVPTSVILTSTSIASLSADVDLSSVQSQSITQAVSSFLPAPSVEPEIPGVSHNVIGGVLGAVFFTLLVVACISCVVVGYCIKKKKNTNGPQDPDAPPMELEHPLEEGSGPAQDTNDDTVNNDNGEAGVQENEYGTMPSSTVLHQGSDSNEWGEETNNNN